MNKPADNEKKSSIYNGLKVEIINRMPVYVI
jgi:hypothetical protein